MARVRGRVIDQAGKILVSVTVRFEGKQGQDQAEAKTSASGIYLTKDLKGGEYGWRASKAGYGARTGVIFVPDSPDLIEIDPFILDQTGSVSGQVTDQSGESVPGVEVAAFDLQNQLVGQTSTNADGNYAIQDLAPIAKDARTDGDGMYTITDLGGGVYTVEVVDAPNQPGYLPAHNVEVVEGAMTAGIDFSEDAVADFVGRLDDGRFSVESRISEEEADQAISLFSVVNLMLAGLSQRQVGNKSRRDILGVLNLYYGLQEGSLRDRFVFADPTALWLGLESELKELARELDRFQSDIDFLNREARRQFNLGLSNNVLGNVQFPALFRRYVEIGSNPLLAFDIKAADQSQVFDKTKIAQADELLKSLKDLILQITRSLSKYGTSATRRVNEDWAKFEARALEVLQTVARERVTPDRSEQNTWVILANLTDRNFDVEVAPYVALARHGGKLLNYAMEIYRETKDRLDEFGAQYLRNLFQRGNNKRDFWTEKIRAEATAINRYPLSGWR